MDVERSQEHMFALRSAPPLYSRGGVAVATTVMVNLLLTACFCSADEARVVITSSGVGDGAFTTTTSSGVGEASLAGAAAATMSPHDKKNVVSSVLLPPQDVTSSSKGVIELAVVDDFVDAGTATSSLIGIESSDLDDLSEAALGFRCPVLLLLIRDERVTLTRTPLF